MNIKDKHTQLALVLLLLNSNNTTDAVVASEQYSSYLPQSHYSQSQSSYGNENQNYFDNPGELSPTNRYSDEPYQRQQFPPTSYSSSGGGFNTGNEAHSYPQPHTQASYQDYLSGQFSSFRQEQDSTSHQASHGRGTSSLVSFDNIDFNKSETTDDVLYPPLDSEVHQQQPHRQQYLQSADYNYISPLTSNRINSLQSMSYLSGDRTIENNAVSANAGAQIMVTMGRPPTPSKLYIENENQQQYEKEHIPKTSQYQPQSPPHYESEFANNSDRLPNSFPSRSYYVADSDPSDSSRNYLPDVQPTSPLHSHLVQLPVESSPPLAVPAPPPSFAIPGEPIPISKHVEITKHVPVPIYRQIHVPVRRPVRIEIPRPVISTIPRPYPFQIPTITKTVAVPLVKEVKIPIEKVTPYPVEHRVPYVVEKRVPFQIEKQVAAPIYYPFPVKVPMVRTIVHKNRAYFPQLHYHPRIHM